MAVENLLFLRKAELIVGTKVTGSNSDIEPEDARVFRTRINFDVEKDEGSTANKAKINIYNLSGESRAFLEQKNLVVFLRVGYETGDLTTLFFGDVDEENGIHNKRSGPDIITSIEAGDGEAALRDSNIQVGLSSGATNLQLIDLAAKKLFVSTAYISPIKSYTFQKGFSYSGSAKGLLDQMAKLSGFQWSIQNGELLILIPSENDQQQAVFLSKETGLIGFPVKTQDKLEFTSLLNPFITPGRAVIVESSIFKNGESATAKVSKAKYKGDTHEGTWEVFAEGQIQNGI